MDLLSIFFALWRHKFAALLVVLLTGAGGAYVLVAQPSVYESGATVLLVPPPRSPSNEQVLADPSLKNINTDNPYTRAYDPGIIISVVSTVVNSDGSRAQLTQKGADHRFEVAQTTRYGFSSPVAEIHATAVSASQAEQTAQIVLAAFREQLASIQSAERVDERYFIGTRVVESPGPGILRTSGKLRGLMSVIGLGVVALFTVISTFDAVERYRADRRANPGGLVPVPGAPEPARPAWSTPAAPPRPIPPQAPPKDLDRETKTPEPDRSLAPAPAPPAPAPALIAPTARETWAGAEGRDPARAPDPGSARDASVLRPQPQ